MSFNNFRASSPNISDILTFSPFATFGGVLGKVKLNNPRIADAIAVIMKVFCSKPFSIPSDMKTRIDRLRDWSGATHEYPEGML